MSERKGAVWAYIRGLADLAFKLAVNPVEFFRTMPRTGGFIDPLLYVVTIALLGVVLSTVKSSLIHGAGIHDLGMLAIWLVIVPLIAAILSFFAAGVCFAIWTLTGSGESYETSYRCLAYMHVVLPVTIILSIVPYLGLLGIAWWLFLVVTATRVVHKTLAWRALLAFGIIAVLSGLVYYSSVTSAIRSRERLETFTRELQQMPGRNGMDSTGSR